MPQLIGIISDIDYDEDTFNLITNTTTQEFISCWEELEVLRNTNIRIGDEVRVFVVGDTPAGDFKIVNLVI